MKIILAVKRKIKKMFDNTLFFYSANFILDKVLCKIHKTHERQLKNNYNDNTDLTGHQNKHQKLQRNKSQN